MIHVSLLEAVYSQPFISKMAFLLARCPHCLLLEVNDSQNVLTPACYFTSVITKHTYCKDGDRIHHWIRSKGGGYQPDFTVIKISDLSLKQIWKISNGPTESQISGKFTLIRRFLTEVNDNQTCWNHLANYRNSMADDWLERKKELLEVTLETISVCVSCESAVQV